MPDSIGTAFVDVALDPKKIEGQIAGLGGRLTGGFGKMGSVAGAAMATGIGAALTGAVVAGKYLYNVGEQFDAMSDTIRASTGKSGEALKELTDTAKGVGTDVPASFENAGKAVASLSTRLGLTGKPLRDVSDQVLELSRLTGADLPSTLNSVTRMLGDAGLKGADAAAGIDKLFRAAQATQVPVNRLADLLTKFGGPMRQLGFSFEEQAALLGKFEKEGVNTELVMGSMRIALGKMAKAGKDPVEGLRATMEAIRDTGSAGEANRKAIELFGARAGPDMAAAIREGRFSIDDLVKTISKGRETVLKAGEATRDFSENWQIFKNKVAVAVAPAAEKMFAAIGDGMGRLAELDFSAISDELGPAIEDLGPAFDEFGAAVKDLTPVFKILGQAVLFNVKTIVNQIRLLLTVVSGAIKIVHGLLTGDWTEAWDGAKSIFGGFVDYFKSQFEGAVKYLQAVIAPIKGTATAIGKGIYDGIATGISTVVAFVTGVFNSVSSAIQGAVGAVTGAASTVGRAILTAVQSAIAGLAAIVTGVFNAVTSAVTSAVSGAQAAASAVGRAILTGVQTVINALAGIVTGVFTAARNAITSSTSAIGAAASAVGRAILTGVQTAISTLGSIVTTAFNAARTAITSALSGISTAAQAVGRAILEGVRTAVSTLAGVVAGFMAQAIAAVRNVASSALSAAQAVGTAIVSGIKSGLAGVYAAVKGGLDVIWGAISSVAGSAAGAARAIGAAITSGVIGGIGDLAGSIAHTIVSKVTSGISWARSHMGSTAEEYAAAQIGKPLADGTIEGYVVGSAPLGDAIAKSVGEAVEKGRRSIESSRGAFSEAWSQLSSDALRAFDAIQGQIQTRHERMLADMEAKRQAAENRARVASLREDLAAAQQAQAGLVQGAEETPEQFAARAEEAKARVLAAQKALDEEVSRQAYEAQRIRFQTLATQERTALNERILLRRRHLEETLKAEETAFATGRTNAETAQKNTIALLNRYGVTYKRAGTALGGSFVTGLKESLNAAMADLTTILERIRRAIEGVQAANANVHPPAPHAAAAGVVPATAGVAATAGGGGGALYGPASPFAPLTRAIRAAGARTPELEAGTPIVRVYIGDEELRGIVRTEVGYVDDQTARVLLAGAR